MQEKAMIYAERSDVLQGVNYIAGKRQNYGKKPRGTQMSAEPWWPVPTHLQDFRCILAPTHHTCLKAHSRACTHAHAHKKKKLEPFCCEQNCITYKGVRLKQILLYKKCDVPVFVQSRKSVLAATPKLPRRSTSVLTSPGTPMEEAQARWVKYRKWWRSGGGGGGL